MMNAGAIFYPDVIGKESSLRWALKSKPLAAPRPKNESASLRLFSLFAVMLIRNFADDLLRCYL